MAKGEYIGLVEADDYIDKNMYLELYEKAKKNDADLVKADFHMFYGEALIEGLYIVLYLKMILIKIYIISS